MDAGGQKAEGGGFYLKGIVIILDVGCWVGPKVKGVKVGRCEGGRRILDFGFWMLGSWRK